jgi:hypothetical protein
MKTKENKKKFVSINGATLVFRFEGDSETFLVHPNELQDSGWPIDEEDNEAEFVGFLVEQE